MTSISRFAPYYMIKAGAIFFIFHDLNQSIAIQPLNLQK